METKGNEDLQQNTSNQLVKAKKGAKSAASNSYTVDAKDPIPIKYNSQLFTAYDGGQYLPFLNPLDTFGQLLTEAKLLSPTTLSCIGSKVKYCLGKGWFLKNSEEGDQTFTDWAGCLNRKQESLNDILNGYFDDRFTSGNSYIEVVRGKVGSKRFVKVYRRSYIDCRLAEPDDDDIPTEVLYSKMFRRENIWKGSMARVVTIPIYSKNALDNPWYVDENGFEHTMFHLKNKIAGVDDYYGLPSNMGSLLNQLIEYKHARHNVDDLDNNMVMGGIVTIKGAMTDGEAKKTAKNLINAHTGDGKVGRWMVLHSEGGIAEGVSVDQFDTQREGSYVIADEHNEKKIYIANQWNKVLIGGTEGKGIGGGNSSYIRSVFDIANNTVIAPEQEHVLEKFIKPLLYICDEFMGTKWSQHEIGLKTVMPVTFLGDIDVNAITTKNEGRELMGKAAKDGAEWEEPIKTNNSKSNDVQDQPVK